MKNLVNEKLRDLGLGKNEVEAYLTLIQYGESSVTDLARKCSVHRVNLYDALNALKKKGLVSELKQDNTTIFKPNEPETLLSYIHSKEQEMRDIIPLLRRNYDVHENHAQTFFGIQGVKHTMLDMLQTKQPVFAFGIPSHLPETLGSFVNTFHRNRVMQKIPIRHIYNENAKERIAYLNKLKYCKAKHLDKKYDVPATTSIYGDKVAIWVFSTEIFSVLITSRVMAESYKKYFDILWELASI